ncbi:hypothetical protein HUA74_00560 [Myxococcus sp. CA051A]|uniref:hypothetical protein n=1 Tax=unclassified Myxococcus TaxID=2648731 RepID=UPI00157A2FE0|nr:hypothetical protein [Myxococcus sp. CA040A]NTX58215.1 hypothetical protein [Myxococcus sp. CA039A]NTX59143.1 hypothetical protein [Myxococcus sp. CA051A]
MSARASLVLAPVARLLAAALLIGGCTKEEPSSEALGTADERTLQKLRQEVDRVNQGGRQAHGPEATRGAPNAQLAGLAAGLEEAAPRQLGVPEGNATVHVDSVAVKLTGLESSHSAKGSGKMSVTTEELFLRVQFVTQNVGPKPVTLDLESVTVVDAQGASYVLARDAQVLAGTRPLRRTWAPEERADIILLFELPPPALREGALHLIMQGTGGEVRIPLR